LGWVPWTIVSGKLRGGAAKKGEGDKDRKLGEPLSPATP